MKISTMLRLRQYHRWLSLFFAPAILFFSLSGLLQVLGLHERHGGYVPAGWIAWMGGIHTHQIAEEHRRPAPPRPPAAPRGEPQEHEQREAGGFVLLKPFVLLMALGLIASALLGIGIALGTRATRRGAAIALAAGVVVPVALLLA